MEPSAELIAELSSELVLVCDRGGRLTWRDERARRLLGAEPGMPLRELVSAGSVEKAERLLADALAGPVEGRELVLDLEGVATQCSFRGVPFQGGALLVGSRAPAAVVQGMAQLTELLSELATLQRETERQRRSIAALHAAEQAARELAERAVQVRDFTLSSVSHDLKTPLTAIKGNAQLLQHLAARGRTNPALLEEKLAHIATLATSMDGMIEQILDIARLQMGEDLRLKRSPTDLIALTQERVDVIGRASGRHPIELRVDGEDGGLTGSWDRPRLTRVIDNLLTNAIKYSAPGRPITVRLQRESEADGAMAVLSVQDQGVGIPSEDLELVFAPFRRARNVAPIDGMGMGLASARQIVERHGGRIAVASELGHGTTFTVRLPLAAPADVTPRKS